MAVSTFTASGAKATTAVKLPKDVFAVEIKTHELLKDAYVAYLANGRENFAVTKKRGEVSGGGRKHGSKKVLAVLVLVLLGTQFGAVVA
jgi:ribosomal protein L4